MYRKGASFDIAFIGGSNDDMSLSLQLEASDEEIAIDANTSTSDDKADENEHQGKFMS